MLRKVRDIVLVLFLFILIQEFVFSKDIGKIVGILEEKNIAEINLGKNNGINESIEFYILRDGKKIAKAKILKLYRFTSQVEITEKDSEVEIDDVVIPDYLVEKEIEVEVSAVNGDKNIGWIDKGTEEGIFEGLNLEIERNGRIYGDVRIIKSASNFSKFEIVNSEFKNIEKGDIIFGRIYSDKLAKEILDKEREKEFIKTAQKTITIQEKNNNNYYIKIDISRNILTLLKGNIKIYEFPVASGRKGLRTPLGKYKIISKVRNPAWRHPSGKIVAGGSSYNPLGRYWLGLSKYGRYKNYSGQYGIHGTNQPSLIGKWVSHGCVRMRNEDIEKIFELISIGTEVFVVN